MKRRFRIYLFSLTAVFAGFVNAATPVWCDNKAAAAAESDRQAAAVVYPMISSGDMLSIDVYNEKGLTGQYRVGETGKIIFPMIGEAQAQGMTIEKFRLALTESLKKFIKDPLVRVDQVAVLDSISGGSMTTAHSAIILGQIKNQGVQALSPGGATLLQVVAQAGGFTPAANPRAVKVVSYRDGKRSSHVYNLYDVLEGRSPDPVLLAGDTIYVPESIF